MKEENFYALVKKTIGTKEYKSYLVSLIKGAADNGYQAESYSLEMINMIEDMILRDYSELPVFFIVKDSINCQEFLRACLEVLSKTGLLDYDLLYENCDSHRNF